MTEQRHTIEEILPIRDINLSLNLANADSVEKVTLEPGSESLEFRRDPGRITVTVPELQIHAMVVMHPKGGNSPSHSPSNKPWHLTKHRRLILEFDHGEGLEYLADVDPMKLTETVAGAGVDFIWVDARGNGGTLLHASKSGPRHQRMMDRDFIGEFTAGLKSRGISFGFYFNMSKDGWSYSRHPEWRQRWQDGTDRGNSTINPDWDNLCHNSPHREYNYTIIEELVRGYKPQAMWLDRFDWGGILPNRFACTCDYCNRKFEAQTGFKLPKAVDWASESWLAFVRWRSNVLTSYFAEAKANIRAIDPSVSVCLNTHNGLDMFGTWFHGQDVESLTREADHITQEIHYEREGFLGHSLIPRFTRSASGGKPIEALSFRHSGHVDFAIKPEIQMFAEAAALMANGCVPMWDDMVYPQGTTEPAVYEQLRRVFDFTSERQPWVGGKPVLWAGVFFSKNTRTYFGRDDAADKYLLEFLGTCRALLESHIPFEILTDADLNAETLGNYAVVVLPNSVCLEPAQAEAVRSYVADGGGLVGSYMASLANEIGRQHRNFALADVFGVDFIEPFTLDTSYLRFAEETELTSNVRLNFPHVHRARILKVQPRAEARSLGRVVQGREGLNRLSYDCHPPMPTESLYPAAVCNQHGAGQTVYFPGLPGTIFSRWNHVVAKHLLASACHLVAARPSPIAVTAPLCVETTLYTAPSGETVVHLVNFQSGLARTWDIVKERFVV